jgi:hypothetical protein
MFAHEVTDPAEVLEVQGIRAQQVQGDAMPHERVPRAEAGELGARELSAPREVLDQDLEEAHVGPGLAQRADQRRPKAQPERVSRERAGRS